jgi:hypothetical protein
VDIIPVVCFGISALGAGTLIFRWVYQKWEHERELERKKAAYERIFRENPKYVETWKDFEIFAHKFMKEMNWEGVSFSYPLKN